jgi:predicted Zn-dependent peptidase
MTRAGRLGAALVAALGVSLVGAAPSAPVPGPDGAVRGTLPGGGSFIVQPAPGAPVAGISLWYRAPSTGFGDPLPGIGRVAATTIAASQPITGTPVGRYVDQLGGRISVTAYPDAVAISTLVPADKAADVIRALTASYFTPVIDDTGLTVAQRDLAEEGFFRQFSPADVIDDLLVNDLFSDGPARFPTVPTAQQLQALDIAKIKAFATRAFRPSNAVLVVTGAVDPSVVQAAVTGPAGAPTGSEPELTEHPVPQPQPLTANGTEAGLGLGWIGPAIANEKEATTFDFISDYLFRPETGVVSKALATSKTTVDGKFVTYHDPGVFLISISGGDLAAAKTIVEAALASVKKPLDPRTFAAARQAFVYHMLDDIQTPGELADNFGWYTVEGNSAYAPGAGGQRGQYFAAATELTPASVAQTVSAYLDRPGASVTVATATAKPVDSKTTGGAAK